MIKKKSQSSLELVMVVGITLGVFSVTLLIIQSYAGITTNNALINQANNIGMNMVENAELVRAYGYPARIEVEYNFPDNINGMFAVNNSLFFNTSLSGYNSLIGFYSNAKMNILLIEDDFYKGKKFVIFEANKTHRDYVNIKRVFKK
ncbi:MAG: hypothetical protein ACOC3X_00805 [Nanoarchaeota archaeon]